MVHIHTDTTSAAKLVRLLVRGQLDLMAVDAFGEALARATRLRWPIDLDLAQVDFIDGSGLSMLMSATSRAQRMGRELRIVDASTCVRRLIEITDTADLLPSLPVCPEGQRVQTEEESVRKPFEALRSPAFRI
jgi:anti-anti-sigma factor